MNAEREIGFILLLRRSLFRDLRYDRKAAASIGVARKLIIGERIADSYWEKRYDPSGNVPDGYKKDAGLRKHFVGEQAALLKARVKVSDQCLKDHGNTLLVRQVGVAKQQLRQDCGCVVDCLKAVGRSIVGVQGSPSN